MSTVRVIRQVPPPVETPPETYDIIGLSREEAMVIRSLLGRCSRGAFKVYLALCTETSGERDFSLRDKNGKDIPTIFVQK